MLKQKDLNISGSALTTCSIYNIYSMYNIATQRIIPNYTTRMLSIASVVSTTFILTPQDRSRTFRVGGGGRVNESVSKEGPTKLGRRAKKILKNTLSTLSLALCEGTQVRYVKTIYSRIYLCVYLSHT